MGQLRDREEADPDLTDESSPCRTASRVRAVRYAEVHPLVRPLGAAPNVAQKVCEGLRRHADSVVLDGQRLEPGPIGLDNHPCGIGVVGVGDELSDRRARLPVDAVGDPGKYPFVSLEDGANGGLAGAAFDVGS